MTDANEGRPLTRRQLRELERAAELARTGGVPPVPDAAEHEQLSDEPERLGRHSTPSVPAAPEEMQPLEAQLAVDAPEAEPAPEPEPEPELAPQPELAPEPAPQPSKPLGRFFGRKKAAPAQQAPIDLPETVAMDRVDADEAERAEVIEAEIEPAPPAQQPTASVPAPWSARRSSVQVDDVQGLDTVDDHELDSLEIDEVIVEQPRVSAHRVAESTPAQLEDKRAAEAEEEPTPTGPSRGQSQRLPVIVNVVSDTSEHHIADLRDQGVATSGSGSSTSSFTANALVLPAGTDSPDFQLEGEDGLLVTGSIDVPEGFASSGRGSASIDGSDVDAEVAEGEVSSPETAPVRASKAVSSYANARVQIAPQKQRTNVVPVAIGAGAGVFVAGVVGVIVWALSQGIL
ncbi:hypothetical protein [Agrococcus sp. Marseille-Q4369]|uniref:hypothetical protein n=1 Tax=Agrococcus sp. Marseille-Q4369 TaxID=2810513 RepID=UPI001B8CA02C|nr:hypothetical protein [Agrococcus sp. Marseille-Q4369]QUW19379.1 hypothetical protein JSQ78_03380 [Agrococcus sp. Marseille-Q4369]